ncbi:collagen alpha-1(I) chain-like [Oenanthe melanoleuca]|uniref:collagen alpha-1(I) chain-like n=1 Tax=Oenanthe melanoleuca TaxID=2939378 RepID=UPI0024C1D3D5|nr:collagen alpha-1(I) chain-like [Oenanthe melanoleuca]
MRKHDREPSERRAPPAPSRAPPSRSRPGAAGGSGASRARTCPRPHRAARPERAGCSRLRAPAPQPPDPSAHARPRRGDTSLPRPSAHLPRRGRPSVGRPGPAGASSPEAAAFPPSRFPRRHGPPVPPRRPLRLPPRPAATAMVVSGRGGGGGSGGAGAGTRGCRGRAGAAPPGTSPACGRAGRAQPAAAGVRAAAAGLSGLFQRGPGERSAGSISGGSRAPAASQRSSFPGRDAVAAETRGYSGKLMSRGRRLWPPAASLRSGSFHRMNWKSGRSHVPGPPPHTLQPPDWGSRLGTNADLANFRTVLSVLSLDT